MFWEGHPSPRKNIRTGFHETEFQYFEAIIITLGSVYDCIILYHILEDKQ